MQTAPERRRYRIDRLTNDAWVRVRSGTNSDDLLALAARTDKTEGVPSANPGLVCWKNR